MKKKILLLASLCLICFAGWLGFFTAYSIKPVAIVPAVAIYDMPKGMGLMQLAYDLHRKGIITHPRLFMLLAALRYDTTRLQAGEYDFGSSITPLQILKKMRAGDVVIHQVTLVEGLTMRQILAVIHDQAMVVPTLQDVDQLKNAFTPQYKTAEGWFFPSTYQFVKGTTDADILKKAHEKMKAVLQQEWQERDNQVPYANEYEALIASSLIEKETAIAQERYLISSVLSHRLQRHMLLQFDPTILYAVGKLKGPITKEDLKISSPFNTYLNYGLPPTPIASPSRASIHAALHPAAVDYLYFVANGQGGHYFSSNLQEHTLAVKKFRDEKNKLVGNTQQGKL